MSSQERPTTAFALSLASGILIFIGGAMMSMMLFYDGTDFGMMDGFWGMMRGYTGMMGGLGFPFALMDGFSLVSAISGILVIVGAIILNSRPKEHAAWGTLILIFSVISFLAMGGFIVGALLGITGGALALSWRPKSRALIAAETGL